MREDVGDSWLNLVRWVVRLAFERLFRSPWGSLLWAEVWDGVLPGQYDRR